MGICPAALNLQGEHIACDWPADDNGKHDGWAHGNRVAQAVWNGDVVYTPLQTFDALDAAQDQIRELTRQRDQARDIAVRCGAWQNGAGTDYEAHLDRAQPMPLVDPEGLLFGGGA